VPLYTDDDIHNLLYIREKKKSIEKEDFNDRKRTFLFSEYVQYS